MFMDSFLRTRLLLGDEKLKRLAHAKVAVFGLGGVGGHTVLSLARSGVGELTLVDSDTVSKSNINRQAIAFVDTVGQKKTKVLSDMVKRINPEICVHTHDTFFLPENSAQFDFSKFDYVVDAVDTVSAKLALAVCCKEAGVPIISCMGTGNKLDPTALEVADIYSTSVCPLARVMRKELKSRGIDSLKVVYSKEQPIKPCFIPEEEIKGGKTPPASCSFVPSVAGLIISAEVIKDL